MKTDLPPIERRLFSRYFDDGLLDLLAGMGLLSMGIGWVLSLVPLSAVAPAVLVPMWKPLRERLVQPRTGSVRFRPDRLARQRRHHLWFIAAGVFTFLLGIGVFFLVRDGAGPSLRVVATLPAVLLAAGAAGVGASLGLYRFLAYAGVLVAGGVAVMWFSLNPGWALVGGGVAVTLVGSLLLARFIRHHPIADPA